MHSKAKISLLLILVAITSCGALAAERDYFKGIKSTGAVWLQFGPAIFKCCKRIDWYKGRPALHRSKDSSPAPNRAGWVEMDLTKVNKLSCNSGDKNFVPLLNWVKQNFGSKLNCSPEQPVYRSVDTADGALILYDDVKATDSNWFCMPHLLTNMVSGEKMHGDVLLVIPLGLDTFSYDENEQKYRMAQLNALMDNKPAPDPTLDPVAIQLKEYKLRANKNCHFVDKTGKVIFDAGDADEVDWDLSEGLLRIQNLNGKKQFWNREGKLAIEGSFDDALRFSEGLCGARLDTKWGYIDHSGKFVIPPSFDDVQSFSEGLAAIRIGDKWGYVDKTGTIAIQPQFDYCIAFSEGLAGASKNGAVGFIDKTGAFAISPTFAHAASFSCGVASVMRTEGSSKELHRWYVDKKGQKVFDYDEVLQKLSKNEVKDERTELPKPFSFREITVGQKNPPREKNSSYDYYQTQPSSEEFSEELLPIWLGHHSAYLKTDGSVAFELDAENAEPFSNSLAAVGMGHSSEKHWGFIDRSGKLVIPATYDSVDQFSDGLAIVSNYKTKPESGHLIIDTHGKVLGHFIDNPARFTEGLCREGNAPSLSSLTGMQKILPGGPNQ